MNKIKKLIKRLFSNRLRAIIVLIVLAGLGIFLYKTFGKKKTVVQIQTQKVERGTIISTVSASGQMLTANIVNLSTQAKGLVKKVYAKDGDKVYAGQKIAEIELDKDGQQANAQAYSSYLSAKNALDSAQVTLWTLDSAMWAANRTFVNDSLARGLLNYDPTYIQQNDNWLAAEAKYKNQRAVVTQSKVALNNSWLSYQMTSPVITAPISGTIDNITLVTGMISSGGSSSSTTTTSSTRVAIVRAKGEPLASFNLSEIDVAKVKIGQKATIKLDSLTDKTFTGKVASVDRIGSVTSGVTNYPIIIKFDTESLEVLPNMSATANIILEAKDNVLVVPSGAIRIQDDQKVVRVMKNKKEESVTVETGLVSDTQTEIISGLSEGDEIITSTTSINNSSSRTGSSPFSGQIRVGSGSFGGR